MQAGNAITTPGRAPAAICQMTTRWLLRTTGALSPDHSIPHALAAMHRRLFLNLSSALGASALLQACGGGDDLPSSQPSLPNRWCARPPCLAPLGWSAACCRTRAFARWHRGRAGARVTRRWARARGGRLAGPARFCAAPVPQRLRRHGRCGPGRLPGRQRRPAPARAARRPCRPQHPRHHLPARGLWQRAAAGANRLCPAAQPPQAVLWATATSPRCTWPWRATPGL